MRLRVEISLGIGVLLAIQAATTLVAVRLLTRMGPALEEVIRENVVTLEAGEDMLAWLAHPTSQAEGGRPPEIADALHRMQSRITEREEPAIIDRIDRDLDAAVAGDLGARRRVVNAIEDLAEVNRDAMSRADTQARTLAATGAWAAVLLGLTAFWASVLIARRVQTRLDEPLRELDAALQAARRGERRRRATVTAGPAEARRIADNVNWLLDHVDDGGEDTPADAERFRGLALRLLDDDPRALVVVDHRGELLAASRVALARLDPGGGGIPAALRAVPPPDEPIEGWRSTHLERLGVWLWVLDTADPLAPQ